MEKFASDPTHRNESVFSGMNVATGRRFALGFYFLRRVRTKPVHDERARRENCWHPAVIRARRTATVTPFFNVIGKTYFFNSVKCVFFFNLFASCTEMFRSSS